MLYFLVRIKLKLHGVARNLHLVEREHRTAHAEMAKVGEEFEAHLDRDLKELEAGQHLITSLKTTHKEFQERVHGIVAATFAQHSQPKLPEAQEHANLQADLQSQLDTAIRDLFDNQSKSVRALVRRLAEGAKVRPSSPPSQLRRLSCLGLTLSLCAPLGSLRTPRRPPGTFAPGFCTSLPGSPKR